MFGGFPFVEGSYLDEFIGFVFVRLIAPMDNNFVEEVGYFRFVAFVREPFVEVGDDLGAQVLGVEEEGLLGLEGLLGPAGHGPRPGWQWGTNGAMGGSKQKAGPKQSLQSGVQAQLPPARATPRLCGPFAKLPPKLFAKLPATN